MKKRLPIFSVLAVIYAIFDLVKIIPNVIHVFSLNSGMVPQPIQSLSGLLPDLAHVGLVIALAILAVRIVDKPECGKIAGWLALVWSGWGCFSLVRSLLAAVTTGADSAAILMAVCNAIPNAMVLVCWLVASIVMVTGKEAKKTALSLAQMVGVGFVMILIRGLSSILGGNFSVASVLISGLVDALPLLAMFAAGHLLHGAFTRPEETPLLSAALAKQVVVILVTVTISLAIFYACEKPKDDGKEYGVCGNCGTRIETKYIFSGGCWRCNGNDWSK